MAASRTEHRWDSWEDHIDWLVDQRRSGKSYRAIADEVDGLHWQQVRRRLKQTERPVR